MVGVVSNPNRTVTLDGTTDCPVNRALHTLLTLVVDHPRVCRGLLDFASAFILTADPNHPGNHPARSPLNRAHMTLHSIEAQDLIGETPLKRLAERGGRSQTLGDAAARRAMTSSRTENLRQMAAHCESVCLALSAQPITVDVISTAAELEAFRLANHLCPDWGQGAVSNRITTRTTPGVLAPSRFAPTHEEQSVVFYAYDLNPDTGRELLTHPIASVNLALALSFVTARSVTDVRPF